MNVSKFPHYPGWNVQLPHISSSGSLWISKLLQMRTVAKGTGDDIPKDNQDTSSWALRTDSRPVIPQQDSLLLTVFSIPRTISLFKPAQNCCQDYFPLQLFWLNTLCQCLTLPVSNSCYHAQMVFQVTFKSPQFFFSLYLSFHFPSSFIY